MKTSDLTKNFSRLRRPQEMALMLSMRTSPGLVTLMSQSYLRGSALPQPLKLADRSSNLYKRKIYLNNQLALLTVF